jgi:hypothetical protein
MGYIGDVCDGAFAELIDLPGRQLLRVQPEVPLNVGSSRQSLHLEASAKLPQSAAR